MLKASGRCKLVTTRGTEIVYSGAPKTATENGGKLKEKTQRSVAAESGENDSTGSGYRAEGEGRGTGSGGKDRIIWEGLKLRSGSERKAVLGGQPTATWRRKAVSRGSDDTGRGPAHEGRHLLRANQLQAPAARANLQLAGRQPAAAL